MKIYFLSSQPCALRLGGVFFGVTDRFERYAEITLQDNIFVEFVPENALPVTFFLTENVRFSPPAHCEVYLLDDGIAIYVSDFTPVDFTLKTLWQKRLDNVLLTVFSQGRLQLAVSTPHNAFTAYLPIAFSDFDAKLCGDYILIHGKTPTEKRLLLFRNTGEKILDEEILSYSLSRESLQAELPLSERFGRTAICTWSLKNENFQRTEFILRARANGEQNTVTGFARTPDDLLAYAFFESVLIGANYKEFLCDELLASADKLLDFLGDFVAVTFTDDPFVCGLVRKKGERLYSLSYYHVKIQDGTIIDIHG